MTVGAFLVDQRYDRGGNALKLDSTDISSLNFSSYDNLAMSQIPKHHPLIPSR